MERGTVGVERYNSYHIGSIPDLKIRSPVKNELHIDSFSNGTKENDKKETLLFPRGSLKDMYLSKFVSCQLLILVTKSCAELLDAGFTNNGVYKILFNNSQVFDVYCDQSSRGGGNIKKKNLPYYARPHLKTYALKEEKCSFPSASFGAIFSGASKVILAIFYFALLCCVIGP